MSALSLQTVLVMKTTECITCGVVTGLTEGYYDQRVQDHKNYYCPNGHSQHFVAKSDADLLREEKERHERTLARLNAEQQESEKIAKERDRLKKRVKAGVCPCCKRTFKQLAAHMQQKHPDFDIQFGKRKLP